MQVVIKKPQRLSLNIIRTGVETGKFAHKLARVVKDIARSAKERAFTEESDPVTRVAWKPSVKISGRGVGWDPGTTMRITGALRDSVRFRARVTHRQATVTAASRLVYATVHQYGRPYPGIPHPGSHKLQWIPSSQRFVRDTIPHYIPIPRRRFVGLSPVDRLKIRKRIARWMLESEQ